MRRLELIRYAVLIVIRDVMIPAAGVVLALTHPQPYELPLIAGMLGTPLVARGVGRPDPDPAALPDAPRASRRKRSR